jgi:excisionase family DNA binding protein
VTLEEAIEASVAAHVSPVLAELRRVTAELEALRRALPPQLVSMPEAAKRLGVSLATVRRRVRDLSLPSRRIGRTVRVDLSTLHPMAESEVARLAARARTG